MTTVLEHTYRPRGACIDLFNYRGPEVLMSGPAGTGKSRACLEKLHRMMLATAGARGLIVRKTGVSLTSTALVTYRQQLAAYRADPQAADQLIAVGFAPLPPGVDKAELAAWTHVARVLLNLHETLTRS